MFAWSTGFEPVAFGLAVWGESNTLNPIIPILIIRRGISCRQSAAQPAELTPHLVFCGANENRTRIS